MLRTIFLFSLLTLALIVSACSAGAAAPPTTAAPSPAAAQPTATAPAAATSAPTDSSTSPTTVAPSSGSSDTVTLTVVPGKSEARYRVREQLASVSLPSDAIGKTNAISGQIVGKTDGTIVSAQSKFVVDLSTLQSDRSQRDGFLRRNTLETSQYPTATFVPSSTQGLSTALPPANPTTFKLIGDLTIRNVTKPVTWDVTCEPQSATQGTCHATTSFTFEYFNMTQPRVPVVLSVEDHITLELDLVLQRVGG